MRDVVIIGGGLSGLAAAYELEQHQVDYTLIEVKRELGGSIHTIQKDGFLLDLGPFALADTLDSAWLDSLGLSDALFHLDEKTVAFKNGTASLVQAIKAKMTGTRLMRMALSSIGELGNGRYSICLENGLLFDAKSLIIALPARYAERVFYGYITPITEMLLGYQYDTIQRVSLVFRSEELPDEIPHPPDMAYVFIHRTDNLSRIAEAYTLLHFGLRVAPERIESPQAVVNFLCEHFNLPDPVSYGIGFWAEADPISCFDDTHEQWVKDIRAQLPERIALIGSDYSQKAPCLKGISDFDERIRQGQEAARKMLD